MDCLTSQFCNKQLITLNWECFVRFIIHKGRFKVGRLAHIASLSCVLLIVNLIPNTFFPLHCQ